MDHRAVNVANLGCDGLRSFVSGSRLAARTIEPTSSRIAMRLPLRRI